MLGVGSMRAQILILIKSFVECMGRWLSVFQNSDDHPDQRAHQAEQEELSRFLPKNKKSYRSKKGWAHTGEFQGFIQSKKLRDGESAGEPTAIYLHACLLFAF